MAGPGLSLLALHTIGLEVWRGSFRALNVAGWPFTRMS